MFGGDGPHRILPVGVWLINACRVSNDRADCCLDAERRGHCYNEARSDSDGR